MGKLSSGNLMRGNFSGANSPEGILLEALYSYNVSILSFQKLLINVVRLSTKKYVL